MTLHGSCLCNEVRFEIEGRFSPIGLCHCSKCRKATGTAAVADFMASAKRFRFTAGEARIQTYQQPSGYRTSFCNQCGSPLPKRQPNGKLYWIPAGLIDGDASAELEVAMHIYVGSKAPWEDIGGNAVQHSEDWPERART